MEETPPPLDSSPASHNPLPPPLPPLANEEQVQAHEAAGEVLYERLTPTAPGFADMFAALLLGFLAGMVAGVCVGAVLAVIYGPGHMREHMPLLVILTMPFQLGVGLWATWYFACAKYHRGLREGLQIRAVSAPQVLRYIGLAVLLAFIAIVSLGIAYMISPSSITGKSIAVKIMQNKTSAAFWMVFALIAPITEELYFRGLAFQVLERKFNTRAALLIVTAWFAGIHFPQLQHDWPGLIGITCTSATVTTLRARTGSVTPGIVVHFVYNMILVGLSMLSTSLTST